MIDLLFRGLQKRLYEQVEAAKIVDYFLDQYDASSGDQRIYGTPALYIEFLPTTFETMPYNIQRAVQQFHVHTVHESAYEDDKRITSADGLNNFMHVQTAVFRALMNWRMNATYLDEANPSATLMESIVRTRSVPDHAMSRLLVNTQTFQATVYDYGAVKGMQPVQVSPAVTAMLVPRL